MRILVTVVTGRIGANLAAALIREGHEVRGLVWPGDARIRKLSGLGIDLVSGTITEVRDVRMALLTVWTPFTTWEPRFRAEASSR